MTAKEQTNIYKIIDSYVDSENGVELRLAQIDNGYSVGLWDVDYKAYYPSITVFPYSVKDAYQKAKSNFEQCIEDMRGR